jgi:hypothetical protein
MFVYRIIDFMYCIFTCGGYWRTPGRGEGDWLPWPPGIDAIRNADYAMNAISFDW